MARAASTRRPPYPKPSTAPFKLPLGYSLVLASSLGLGFTLLWTYQSYRVALRTPLPTPHDIASTNATLAHTWQADALAATFDDSLARYEYWSGILARRRELCVRARGHVLESGVGTGRNVEYYAVQAVRSLTAVDQSRALLRVCQGKWEARAAALARAGHRVPGARFLVGDLQGERVGQVLRPERISAHSDVREQKQQQEDEEEDGRFDTVVQTMALCSTPDPVALLRNLARAVRPDGQILLLEHGQSHYTWLNQLLAHTALAHARQHGCWWDRDIGAIVAESGLVVQEMRRFNLGTTWWFVLRPAAATAVERLEKPVRGMAEAGLARQSRWWQFW